MKRAIIYNRVSRDEQVENYSLDTQAKLNREYAAKEGLFVVGEYFEDFTGAEMERPEMSKILELSYAKEFDVLLVSDLDRFARGLVVQIQLEGVLGRNGVSLKTVLNNFSETSEGDLQKNIHAVFAEYERTKIRERMMRGKKGRAEAGHIITGMYAKYGYRYVAVPHGGCYEVEPSEAEVVNRVFELFACGDTSIRKIASILSNEGIPTRADSAEKSRKKNRKRGEWCPSSVANMLKDPAYIGKAYYNKTKAVKTANGKTTFVGTPEESWIEISVPPIIEVDLWGRVQQIRADRFKEKPKPTLYDFLVKGALRCKTCGRKISTHASVNKQGRLYMYYKCSLCCKPGVRSNLIDDAVWEVIRGIVKDPSSILAGLEEKQRNAALSVQQNEDKISVLETRLETVESQMNKLLDLYLSSSWAKALFDEKADALKVEKQNIAQELIKLRQFRPITSVKPEQILDLCAKIQQGIDLFQYEQKRKTLELLQVKVEYNFDNRELTVGGIFVGEVSTSFEQRVHFSNTIYLS